MPRAKQVNIRLGDEERQVLQQAADLQEQPLATFVRLAAIEQAHQLLHPEATEAPAWLPAWLQHFLLFFRHDETYLAPGAATPAPPVNAGKRRSAGQAFY